MSVWSASLDETLCDGNDAVLETPIDLKAALFEDRNHAVVVERCFGDDPANSPDPRELEATIGELEAQADVLPGVGNEHGEFGGFVVRIGDQPSHSNEPS